MRFSQWTIAWTFVGLAGCGAAPPVVSTALHGDLATLKREVQSSQRAGSLDAGVVRDLAHAVAGREIRSARGPDAPARIAGLVSCAQPLQEVLEDRASRHDGPGAAALLLLVEAGRRDPIPLVDEYASSADGAWRAVGARGTVDRSHATMRRAFFRDPDQRVRRAALDAAFPATDSGDTEELLEVVRVDPDPLCQSKGARALGAIGGVRAVLGLKDRFASSDDVLQSSIADAWGMPHAFASGGERELSWVVTTQQGLPLVTAALALSRSGRGTSAELGAGALARVIGDGTENEQLAALSSAPLSDARVRAAVNKAATSSDSLVRVAAFERLASVAGERARAMDALRKLVHGREPAKQAAALALAELGDASAAPILDAALGERSSSKRERAALALLALTRYPSVATALADDDPDVRASVACSVLAKAR